VNTNDIADVLSKVLADDSYNGHFGYLFQEVLGNPKKPEVSNDVAKVLGRPAKDFEAYAKQTAATGIWNQVSV